MISLRARIIRYFLKRAFARLSPDADLAATRREFERTAARYGPPRDVRIRSETIAGVDGDWLVPPGCDEAPLLYFLHGGAYVMGSSRTHRRMLACLAKAAAVRAYLPNYRLAPEHPFPHGIEDASNVYRELLMRGESPSRIAIGGDSAGGGLTMATLLTLRERDVPMPAGTVLLSPWLDLTASGESMHSRAGIDPLFRPQHMPGAADFYCDRHSRRDPRVSPVFADVSGLPPTLVQVGDHEILLSDATRIVERLTQAGVPATLDVWPEMWHVFQFFAGLMPEATRAIGQLAIFLSERFKLRENPHSPA